MIDLALAENFATVFTAQLLNSDEQAVARLLTHPQSGGVAGRCRRPSTFFNDAGFGLHPDGALGT